MYRTLVPMIYEHTICRQEVPVYYSCFLLVSSTFNGGEGGKTRGASGYWASTLDEHKCLIYFVFSSQPARFTTERLSTGDVPSASCQPLSPLIPSNAEITFIQIQHLGSITHQKFPPDTPLFQSGLWTSTEADKGCNHRMEDLDLLCLLQYQKMLTLSVHGLMTLS
jgi:hypothetical protein